MGQRRKDREEEKKNGKRRGDGEKREKSRRQSGVEVGEEGGE